MQNLSAIPFGYQKGNKLLLGLVYLVAITLEFPFILFRRHSLLGKDNLDLIRQYRKEGKKIALDFDHYSVMDIPIPLALFWWHGFRDLTNNLFFLIGIRWAEKWLLKGANRAYVVPPTEMPKEKINSALRPITDFNKAAKLAAWKAQTELGAILWLSAHGTRSRNGIIEAAPEGARRFWQKADYVVPVALEGTREVMHPGLKWWEFWHTRPWTKVKVIVGTPLPQSQIPTTKTVVYERARLHLKYGNSILAGVYLEELLEEYRRKEVRLGAL